jgi:hypothetical protein
MDTIKRFARLATVALSTLLLLAMTVAPVAAGGRFP